MLTEFCAPNNPSLPPIPNHLTIPQFMLDFTYPSRPHRLETIPWLLEDHSARPIHYKEIRHRTRALANGLHLKWNIRDNDVVCIFSPNDVDYPISIWAIHTLGAIVTPANPGYTTDELLYQLQTTKARLLIVHSTFLQTARAAAKQAGLSPDRIVVIPAPGVKVDTTTINDVAIFGSRRPESFQECRLKPGEAKIKRAFLSFSSGTTGKPKAVEIPHHSVIANVLQMAVHFQVLPGNNNETNEVMRPGGVVAAVLPFFHIYGLVVQMHFMLFCGLSLVVIPKFSFVEYLKSCQRHRITHLFCVPPQVVLMCKHPATKDHDLSHVKFFMSGAAPLSGELVDQLQKICPNSAIGQGYGLTETCTTISALLPTQKVGTIGSAGQILPGIKARVIKADGSLAREGEQGELVVTGPSMALGYLNNEQATKETFIDGWVRTGDEVIIRNGEIFVVDRLKEIIKVKGFQVAPAELEGHLLLHPAVADACVVGIPDEYKGEVPLAYVVISDKFTSEMKSNPDKLKTEIMKHVSANKVQYKWLAGVEFIGVIPKNPSGKVLRRILRDKARAERNPLKAKL